MLKVERSQSGTNPVKFAQPMAALMSTPRIAADCVVFNPAGRLLVIRRANPPFAGQLALPGGFVEAGESVDSACRRELFEETGLTVGALRLVGVYSEPGRDPRGPVVSIAYLARVGDVEPRAGDDAAATQWIAPEEAKGLAFDHDHIVADALAHVAPETTLGDNARNPMDR